MKNLFKAFALLAVLSFTLNSCTDACENLDCVNGTCNEGTCICADHYLTDGDGICTVMRNSTFAGTYYVQTTCNSGATFADTLQVEAGSSADAIILRGYNGIANNDITMTVSMTNAVDIAQQTTDASIEYSGMGDVLGSVISISNLYSSGDTCAVTMTKQ